MLTPPHQRHGCSSSYFLEVGGGALILRHRQPIYKVGIVVSRKMTD